MIRRTQSLSGCVACLRRGTVNDVAVLVYVFLTSLITAIFWKQIWAYLDRKKREQRQ